MSDTILKNSQYQEALSFINRFDDKEIKARVQQAQNTEMQVEATLWAYVSSIFKHVQEDYEFKLYVQDLLRERLSSADLDTIIRIYTQLNNHESRSLEVSLAPFAGGRNSENSPLLDNVRKVGPSVEESLHGDSSSEMLRAFDQLSKLLSSVQSNT